ncbi:MAG: dienelactone hydrolase family protein [Deltaproteobacteria bacterium]|nr:MAG: dienelactone hydrolase family protein [Deltaproteobacteria bacterium]
MCDELTEAENQAYLNRRQLGLGLAATAALTACGGASTESPEASGPGAEPEAAPEAAAPATSSRRVTISTPDGEADGLFVFPTAGDKHPAVLLWPDVAGLRPAYETMATRLASEGYAVLAINPYYRGAKSPVLTTFDEWRTDEGKAKIAPLREALTPDALTRDAVALVAWLDAQPEVDATKKVGTQGYCMSGPFTFRVAAAVPDRVGAIASFHGGGLVTEEADSPHTLFATMQAAALVCIASNDHERDPEAKPALEAAAKEAGRSAEIEVYPANHGWCALDSPVYDKEQAERAWSRLLATYAANLA